MRIRKTLKIDSHTHTYNQALPNKIHRNDSTATILIYLLSWNIMLLLLFTFFFYFVSSFSFVLTFYAFGTRCFTKKSRFVFILPCSLRVRCRGIADTRERHTQWIELCVSENHCYFILCYHSVIS